MNAAQIIEEQALLLKDELAIEDKILKKLITYGQLYIEVGRAAVKISKIKEVRVGLNLANTSDWIIAYFGILACGKVVVTLNSTWPKELMAEKISELKIKTVIDDEFMKDLPMSHNFKMNDRKYEDVAVIQFTSGTTGSPKAVQLSHLNVIQNRKWVTLYSGLHPEDRVFCFLPFYHCYGQSRVMNSTLFSGATLVIDQLKLSHKEDIPKKIASSKASVFFGLPVVYEELLDQEAKEDLKRVRYFFSGGDWLIKSTEERWYKMTNKHICQAYGKTETSPMQASSQNEMWKSGSVGKTIRGCKTKMVNGEILVRGPNLSSGYLINDQLVSCTDSNGWHHTQDIAEMDKEGYLFLKGRKDDMFIINGENIFPQEIEAAAKRICPELSIIAGETMCAKIKAVGLCIEGIKDENKEKMFREGFSKYLPKIKIPKVYQWVESFPRTGSGKIVRKKVIGELYNNDLFR